MINFFLKSPTEAVRKGDRYIGKIQQSGNRDKHEFVHFKIVTKPVLKNLQNSRLAITSQCNNNSKNIDLYTCTIL